MYLVINKDGRIVASAGYAVNEEDCATRKEKVIYIDDSFYTSEMIGSIYTENEPYFLKKPSPFHFVVDGEYVIDANGIEQFWQAVRTFRNRLLTLTDWTQLPDVKLSEADTQSWLQIRQELRNVTTTAITPEGAMQLLESYAAHIMGT